LMLRYSLSREENSTLMKNMFKKTEGERSRGGKEYGTVICLGTLQNIQNIPGNPTKGRGCKERKKKTRGEGSRGTAERARGDYRTKGGLLQKERVMSTGRKGQRPGRGRFFPAFLKPLKRRDVLHL